MKPDTSPADVLMFPASLFYQENHVKKGALNMQYMATRMTLIKSNNCPIDI